MAHFTVPQRSSSVRPPSQLAIPTSRPEDFGGGVADALGDIAVTVQKRQAERQAQLDELFLLKRKTELSEVFNQARINAETRTGEDALNLVSEQAQEWDEKKLNELYPPENVPDHLRVPLMKLYESERNSHLDRLTTYQIAEEKRYNKTTRDQASFVTARDATDSQFGDMYTIQSGGR